MALVSLRYWIFFFILYKWYWERNLSTKHARINVVNNLSYKPRSPYILLVIQQKESLNKFMSLSRSFGWGSFLLQEISESTIWHCEGSYVCWIVIQQTLVTSEETSNKKHGIVSFKLHSIEVIIVGSVTVIMGLNPSITFTILCSINYTIIVQIYILRLHIILALYLILLYQGCLLQRGCWTSIILLR